MDSKKGNNLVEKHLLKNLAHYISQGYTLENAAFKIDIDPSTALELTSSKDWDKTLGSISESALKAWKEGKELDSISADVVAMAVKDGPQFYRMMKEDVKSLENSPKERAPLLEKLLRLGKYFDKTEVQNTITLSPSQIAAIRAGKSEMDLKPDEIKSPYDA